MVWKLEVYYQTLLNNFLLKTQTFQTFALLHLLTLVVLPQLLFPMKMSKPKREEAGSFSKNERQKMQILYTQGCAAFGSVPILVKTSNLPVSEVRQFLLLKRSYTKIALATRIFKRLKAFAAFQNEVWCMDLT